MTNDAAPVRSGPRLVRGDGPQPVAHGWALFPPDGEPLPWRPPVEGVAAGVAAVLYPHGGAVLCGMSAAALHGAVPRRLGAATVAVPRRGREPFRTDDLGRIVFFRVADVGALDTTTVATAVATATVTTVEQTVLDLAADPEQRGVWGQRATVEALAVLAGRSDWRRVERLAAAAGDPRLADEARRLAGTGGAALTGWLT